MTHTTRKKNKKITNRDIMVVYVFYKKIYLTKIKKNDSIKSHKAYKNTMI